MTKIRLAHSELTYRIYAIVGREKVDITEQAIAEVKAVEALKQGQKREWIPVDEQLPEPWESVLITFSGKHGGMTADHAVGLGSWDGSSNGWYFEEIGGYAKRLTVEAWQPLPEAYMAEDGEEGKA